MTEPQDPTRTERAGTEPSSTERARTSLALATAATLTTSGCPTSRTLTMVSIQDQPDGRPTVWLDRASPMVRILAACPVATLSVSGPSPFRALDLTGPLHPCRSDRTGRRAYRLSPLSAHLIGATRVPIPLGEFFAAAPDPLRREAGAVVGHLAAAHCRELLACVRAHVRCDVEAVVPQTLDRYGLELSGISAAGVCRLRLAFLSGPVESMDQAMTGLRMMLSCRCLGSDRG